MLLHIIHRFATLFSDSPENDPTESPSAAKPAEFHIDPVWHGDHWQNLLSSPMDARHYVMEDWSVAPGFDWAPATVTAARR
jgi:hypothetical protein